MLAERNFAITELENGKFVVEGQGYYQNIDFRTGELITTEEQAIEVRDALIESINNPTPPEKTEIEILKEQVIAQQVAINMILGV